MTRRAHGQAGFTLMEVMVALAILAMVSALIWTAYAQTNKTKKTVEATNDRYHQARIAMRKICSDLGMAYLTRNINPRVITTESAFIGRNDDPDSLDFMAFAHKRRIKDARESDQCEIGYRVVEHPEDRDRKVLVRRESFRVDDDPEEGGAEIVLVEDVLEFELEFYDPTMQEWLDQWDTTQLTGQPNRLPYQVRIRLVIQGRDEDDELEFTTQTPVNILDPVFYSGQ